MLRQTLSLWIAGVVVAAFAIVVQLLGVTVLTVAMYFTAYALPLIATWRYPRLLPDWKTRTILKVFLVGGVVTAGALAVFGASAMYTLLTSLGFPSENYGSSAGPVVEDTLKVLAVLLMTWQMDAKQLKDHELLLIGAAFCGGYAFGVFETFSNYTYLGAALDRFESSMPAHAVWTLLASMGTVYGMSRLRRPVLGVAAGGATVALAAVLHARWNEGYYPAGNPSFIGILWAVIAGLFVFYAVWTLRNERSKSAPARDTKESKSQ